MAGRADKHKEFAEQLTHFRKHLFKQCREDIEKAVGADKLLPVQSLRDLEGAYASEGAKRFARSFGQRQRRHRKKMKYLRSH